MTTPVATDLSALPTLSSQLNELDEAQLNGFADAAVALIAQATTVPELQELRVQLTGKKSSLTQWSKQMGKLAADDKKTYGGWLHGVRSRINQALSEQQQQLETAALNAKLAKESIDITLPARGAQKGHLHPVTMITQRMQQFFVQAGFNVATGPEVIFRASMIWHSLWFSASSRTRHTREPSSSETMPILGAKNASPPWRLGPKRHSLVTPD